MATKRRACTATFFLRPHLAEFLAALSGPPPVRIVDPRDAVAQFAQASLAARRPKDRQALRQFANGRRPFAVELSGTMAERHGRHVDFGGAAGFERLVHHLFAHMLHTHLEARPPGTTRQQAIEQFTVRFHISPDSVDRDSLARMEHRLRSRLCAPAA